FKASHVLNNRKTNFYCKFNFEIDGTDYFIERVAKKNNKGDVSVKVNFWYVDDAGEAISLNGAQRRETDHIIENYIGTYDDFVLTALSLQNNNTLFIDKSQSEKKDLLAQFLGINVFDRLY